MRSGQVVRFSVARAKASPLLDSAHLADAMLLAPAESLKAETFTSVSPSGWDVAGCLSCAVSSRWHIAPSLSVLDDSYSRSNSPLSLSLQASHRRSRELIAPIIRMNGKLDCSDMSPAHAIRPLRGPHFNLEVDARSRLSNQPTLTRPDLGLEALIAVHVESRSALCLFKGTWGPIRTAFETLHIWLSVSLRARSPTCIAGGDSWLAERDMTADSQAPYGLSYLIPIGPWLTEQL